jgi:threonine/homoserine/homoserine lactone efflux protein
MLTAIGQGFVFGIALAFSLGPSFFGLIQTSLKRGYKSGIAMALGIFMSDFIYLLLAWFGLSAWLMDDKYAIPVGITGGILLIGYGIYQFVKKTKVQNVEGEIPEQKNSYGAMALKGFLMNLFNPFVIFLWIGAISLATTKFNNDVPVILTCSRKDQRLPQRCVDPPRKPDCGNHHDDFWAGVDCEGVCGEAVGAVTVGSSAAAQ